MKADIVIHWASQNHLSVAAIFFGVAALLITLYTYVHDYVLLPKSH